MGYLIPIFGMVVFLGSAIEVRAEDLSSLDLRIKGIELQVDQACGKDSKAGDATSAAAAKNIFEPGGYGDAAYHELGERQKLVLRGIHETEAVVMPGFASKWEEKADRSRVDLEKSTKLLHLCRVYRKKESITEYYRDQVKAAWKKFEPFKGVDAARGVQQDPELGPQYRKAVEETRKRALADLSGVNSLSRRLDGARMTSWGCYCRRNQDPNCESKEESHAVSGKRQSSAPSKAGGAW